jgi:hypothetical protein
MFELPLASRAQLIDLEAAVRIPASSVPWHGVCDSPRSVSFSVES